MTYLKWVSWSWFECYSRSIWDRYGSNASPIREPVSLQFGVPDWAKYKTNHFWRWTSWRSITFAGSWVLLDIFLITDLNFDFRTLKFEWRSHLFSPYWSILLCNCIEEWVEYKAKLVILTEAWPLTWLKLLQYFFLI